MEDLRDDDLDCLALTRDQFDAVLERHFVTRTLTREELDQLHAGWRELAASDAAIRGLEGLFEPRDAGRLHGVGWWEEFVAAAEDPDVPEPTAADLVAMYLSSTTPFHVVPRFHCPETLAGAWRLVSVDPKHGEAAPPPGTQMLVQCDKQEDVHQVAGRKRHRIVPLGAEPLFPPGEHSQFQGK